MCEPWCWPPDVVARLCDAEVDAIRRAQIARNEVAKRMAKAEESIDPSFDPSRKGALWEYLVSTGMTPEEADEATKHQG